MSQPMVDHTGKRAGRGPISRILLSYGAVARLSRALELSGTGCRGCTREGLNKRAEAWIWAWLVTHWRLSGVMGGGDAALRFRRGCRPDCGHITPAGRPLSGAAPPTQWGGA